MTSAGAGGSEAASEPPARPYLELSLSEWMDALASPGPIPGSGSALAYATATAASVLVLAARASLRTWQGAGGAVAQAEVLQTRAAPLAERDAKAYGAVAEARSAAAGLPAGEQSDLLVGTAYEQAAEPPLEICRVAADVADLAAEIAAAGAPLVQADAFAAGWLAAGAAEGAAGLVAVNLTATADDRRVVEARRLADAARDAARAMRISSG